MTRIPRANYLRLSPAEFLLDHDVVPLTFEERAAYLYLLVIAWQNEASLPVSEEAIRGLVHASKPAWRKLWPSLAPFFPIVGDLRRNPRQAEDWSAWEEFVTLQKTRARSRWSGSDMPPHSHRIPTAMPPLSGGNAKGREEKGREVKEEKNKSARTRFIPPTVEEVREYAGEKGWPLGEFDPDRFHLFYGAKGWMIGRSPMKDWRLAAQKAHREGWCLPPVGQQAPEKVRPRVASLAELK